MNKNCFKCKCGETEDNPLMPDSYYEDIYLCHDCWFSEDIQKWRNEKEKTDPLYKRYSDLTTAGFKISCPSCGKETNRSPKFIGHSPTWEVCCTKCSETDYNTVSPYKYDLSKWHVLYESFMKGKLDIDKQWDEILELEKESNIPRHKCKCGGEFSMVAKPRCSSCNTVVFNSIFHVCDEYYA